MDPKYFADDEYSDGTTWGPGDECQEREIIKQLCPEYEESFRAVCGFGERRVVVARTEGAYSVTVQRWDEVTKGHILEEYEFDSERKALKKAHKLLGIKFEAWRFGLRDSE